MSQIHKHSVGGPGYRPGDTAISFAWFRPMTLGIDGRGHLAVWGAGDSADGTTVPFRIAFTGGDIAEGERIISTAVTSDGLVWHLMVAVENLP